VVTRRSRLSLVDLAGSERQKAAETEGDRLKEAQVGRDAKEWNGSKGASDGGTCATNALCNSCAATQWPVAFEVPQCGRSAAANG